MSVYNKDYATTIKSNGENSGTVKKEQNTGTPWWYVVGGAVLFVLVIRVVYGAWEGFGGLPQIQSEPNDIPLTPESSKKINNINSAEQPLNLFFSSNNDKINQGDYVTENELQQLLEKTNPGNDGTMNDQNQAFNQPGYQSLEIEDLIQKYSQQP